MLFRDAMERFEVLAPLVSDGEGGLVPAGGTEKASRELLAALSVSDAQAGGWASQSVPPGTFVALCGQPDAPAFGDRLRRVRDGSVFQVVTDPTELMTPASVSALNLAGFRVERTCRPEQEVTA